MLLLECIEVTIINTHLIALPSVLIDINDYHVFSSIVIYYTH